MKTKRQTSIISFEYKAAKFSFEPIMKMAGILAFMLLEFLGYMYEPLTHIEKCDMLKEHILIQ